MILLLWSNHEALGWDQAAGKSEFIYLIRSLLTVDVNLKDIDTARGHILNAKVKSEVPMESLVTEMDAHMVRLRATIEEARRQTRELQKFVEQ